MSRIIRKGYRPQDHEDRPPTEQQSNGIVERLHCTLPDEHLRIQGRTVWHETVAEMQTTLDAWRERLVSPPLLIGLDVDHGRGGGQGCPLRMVDTPLPGSMPRRRRYRRWSAEEKRSICRETRAPGVSVAQVARRHALNANLIFKWLKDRRFAPADAVEAAPVFLPVEIHGGEVPTARMASPAHGAHGRVEIVLATAHRLIVEGPFDADALARLLSVLARP